MIKHRKRTNIHKITTAIVIISLMLIPNYLILDVKSFDILNYKQEENITINNYEMESFEKITSIINQIEQYKLENYLDIITNDFFGRETGTNACTLAGDWIYEELNEYENLEVEKMFWEGRADVYRGFKKYNGFNIKAEIQDTSADKGIFLLTCSYDGKENSPNALDNGAGVASMLLIAKILGNFSFQHTIRILFFSGEEQGAVGSYNYAKEVYNNEDNIIAVLNSDVIGNNTYHTDNQHLLRAFATYPSEWIIPIMNNTCKKYNINIKVEDRPYHGNSDDKAFDDYGYAAMQLFQSGNQMEKFYNSPEDTIELINFSYLTDVTKCIAASIATLADTQNITPKINVIKPSEDSIYILNDKPVNILDKGYTILLRNPLIETHICYDDEVEIVKFELILGRNEDETIINRSVIAQYIDDYFPYEWEITDNLFGWHTIRVTLYDGNGKSYVDEIETYFFNIF